MIDIKVNKTNSNNEDNECGNPPEDIEDKIMSIRLKRMKIQMEREQNLKFNQN